jgi:hypothetical protein
VDGDYTDNPQIIASVFNEYFLSVAEKTLPQDNTTTTTAAATTTTTTATTTTSTTTTTNTTTTTTTTTTINNNNNGISHIKDKYSSTINSDPSHYVAHVFTNSFLNIQLKFSTAKEIESIIKSVKPKKTCGYDEISTKLLKISSAYITSTLNHICNTSLLSGTFLNA